MITTIQLRDSIKRELLKLKGESQTFEDVIVFLLQEREKNKQRNIRLIKTEANELKNVNQEISRQLHGVEDVGGEKVEW